MKRVGVLALQGGFQEHLQALSRLPNVGGAPVKTENDLTAIDGLILPGGESTAIGKLLRRTGLLAVLREKIARGLPVWGTCAGMILLAKQIAGEAQTHLAAMDITVRRNGYGSQLNSFHAAVALPELSSQPIPLVFIRAPYVEKIGRDAVSLLAVKGKIVAVKQNRLLATAFHPELTADLSFHRYFTEKFIGA